MGQGVVVDDGFIVNTNPATGEIISRVKCSLPEEVDHMVKIANEAQRLWVQKTCQERIQLLNTALTAVKEQSEKLVKWMVTEMGKPIIEAQEEMEGAVGKEEFMVILESSLQPQTFGTSTVVRDPLGVVVILSPWNYPVDEILLLALPALASGNTGACDFWPSHT
jgi:acyl-CoA reductase-like NAD-dependent aldehyde dehydrogenase